MSYTKITVFIDVDERTKNLVAVYVQLPFNC